MTSKLVIDPSAPSLQVPSSEPQNLTLTLKNPTEGKLGFKVKCTNNTRFKLRPVIGVIDPGGQAAVGVTVEPLDTKPDTKDCFGVYESVATDDDAQALWKANPPSEVNYIYVNYMDAAGAQIAVPAPCPVETQTTLQVNFR